MESDLYLALFGFASFGFAALVLLLYFKDWAFSFLRRAPTRSPKTPKWLQESIKIQSALPGAPAGVKMYCRSFQWNEKDTPTAIYKVQSLLDRICEHLEHETVRVPQYVCEILVPGRNFQVGINGCYFISMCPHKQENSYYLWQMFGNDAIQACYYYYNNQKHLAGLAFYVETPFAYGVKYRESVIDELMSIPHFYPHEARETLKLSWCVIDEQPVVITTNGVGCVNRFELTPDGFNRLTWNRNVYMPGYPRNPRKEMRKVLVRMCNGHPVSVAWTKTGKVVHLEYKGKSWSIQKECDECKEEMEKPPKYSSLKSAQNLLELDGTN